MAGIRDRTPIDVVLDVMTVVVMDTPGQELAKWRAGMDRAGAAMVARQSRQPAHITDPDDRAAMRRQWGLLPGQIDQHRRFLETMTTAPGGGRHRTNPG
jgi:hypothetical protein